MPLAKAAGFLRGSALVLCLFAFASRAYAYPTAVVFAPSSRVLEPGTVAAFALASSVFSGGTAGGQGFAGAQAGLWGGLNGGYLALETGLDLIYRGDRGVSPLTPLFNAKLQLAPEGDLRPAIAAGVYQISQVAEASAELAFVALTKGLRAGRWGEVTVGGLLSLAPSSQTTQCQSSCSFRGSAPDTDGRWGLFAGWFAPPVGPFRFGLDYISGTSLASGANVSVAFLVDPAVALFAGGSLAVDRRAVVDPSDSIFAGLSFTLQFLKTPLDGRVDDRPPSPNST